MRLRLTFRLHRSVSWEDIRQQLDIVPDFFDCMPDYRVVWRHEKFYLLPSSVEIHAAIRRSRILQEWPPHSLVDGWGNPIRRTACLMVLRTRTLADIVLPNSVACLSLNPPGGPLELDGPFR